MRVIFISFFLFLISCILFSTVVVAQNKKFSITARIPLQIDFQKATFKDVHFPFEFKEHSVIATNWGIDLLSEKEITKKLGVYIGIGYLRDRFNFQRFYDHQLLNIGTDSLPIGTTVYNYTYHLFRLPIGIAYKIIETKKLDLQVGFENIFSFSFLQIYNGAKPFANANNKLSHFRYFGNSIMFFIQFSKPISNTSSLKLEPYLRISNTYRKDPILYENANETNARTFDAFGLAIKYSFTLKKN